MSHHQERYQVAPLVLQVDGGAVAEPPALCYGRPGTCSESREALQQVVHFLLSPAVVGALPASTTLPRITHLSVIQTHLRAALLHGMSKH